MHFAGNPMVMGPIPMDIDYKCSCCNYSQSAVLEETIDQSTCRLDGGTNQVTTRCLFSQLCSTPALDRGALGFSTL